MKYRGSVKITNEFLKGILALPKELEITSIEYNPIREVVNIIFSSNEEVSGFTYKTAEGQEVSNIDTDLLHKGRLQQFYDGIERLTKEASGFDLRKVEM